MTKFSYDCIVVGGGHAGIEAAHAAAKIGAETALLTIRSDTIGQMSCNPAIGGLAKGQMAREIDAMGGLMALAVDATGIQFRILNKSKGQAVQSPRAQADRHRYAEYMRQALEATDNLTIIEGLVAEILTEKGQVTGVRCKDGSVYRARTVVLTTGTFLGGKLHMGPRQWSGGRIDEPASVELSDSLRRLGLKLGRMSTDTTPRIDAATVDFDKLDAQTGDNPPVPFSFMTDSIETEQVCCWVTYTNEDIHQLMRDNLHRAPLSSGQVEGADPRYCPSLEGKIVRFADKKRHRVILEPEESDIRTLYCNGIFTSMPTDVQEQILRMLPGTERARIIRYAYAIEYDYCPPLQLRSNLETKKVRGLFLAGQINGTSGYEEAGGQGIVAGINAAAKIKGQEPLVLGRDQAYIGVLINDLLTRQIEEPYRMFTSRAEYRLALRADNADRRLTPIGRQVGLVDDDRWQRFEKKVAAIDSLKKYLQQKRTAEGSLWQQLHQPGNKLREELFEDDFVRENAIDKEAVEAAVIEAKYEGYVAKQKRIVKNFKSLQKMRLPEEIDYSRVEHLRGEAREKLSEFRPETLDQASRISGISPADITVLQVYIRKYHRAGSRTHT